MSISPQQYVNIVSGVGASANIPTRALVARFFTGNLLVPPKSFVEFTSAAQVTAYFGAASEEALRANFYFSFLSKTLVQPASIQFARWTPVAAAPMIQSSLTNNSVLSNWTSINNGSFGITLTPAGGVPVIGTFSGIDFTSAVDMSDVAEILTLAVQSEFITNDIGSLTNGSTTVTGLTSTAALVAGMNIIGNGVPSGTTIASITNATTIVMSGPALGAVQTGDIASGSDAVTGLQDTVSLVVGMKVTGTGIPLGTTIDSITNTTSIVLSANATATATAENLSFMPAVSALEFFTPSSTIFAGSTVTYSAGRFIFTGGVTGDYSVSLQEGLTGTDITPSPMLGWLPLSSSIVSNGSLAETITEALETSVSASNNFGSFLFLNNLNLSLADAVLAGQWNVSKNNSYMFCAPVTASNYAAWTDDTTGLGLLGGTALTLSGAFVSFTGSVNSGSAVITGLPGTEALSVGMRVSGANIPANSVIIGIAPAPSTDITISNAATGSASEVITFTFSQFPEQVPMMVLAATDYYAVNSVQNYMFQGPFASLFPMVSSDSAKDMYDAASVNYYGNTQQAGQPVNFYQTGVLQGASPSPLDMTTYANEMWLKDAITTEILNVFIGSTQVPANAQGRAQILASLQAVINTALLNGTISVDKELSQQQKAFITAQSGDPRAWYQVQSIGYWVDCRIVNTAGVYSAEYILIYSKDDVIRKVDGRNVLI